MANTPDFTNMDPGTLMTMLWDHGMGNTLASDDLGSLLNTMHGNTVSAEQAAAAAGKALSSAVAAPLPSTHHAADAIITALGGAASSLLGNQGPSQVSADTIKTEQERLNQKRHENLVLLEKSYTAAAERAAKLGDLEAESNFRAKADKAARDAEARMHITLANIEAGNAMARTRLETSSRERVAALDRAAELTKSANELAWDAKHTDLANRQSERNAYIGIGVNPDDPSKPLSASYRYNGRLGSTSKWVSQPQYINGVEQAKLRSMKGKRGSQSYDENVFRSNVLTLAPPAPFAQTPVEMYNYLTQIPSPKDPNRYLFKRDPKDPRHLDPAAEQQIYAYMKRWWPDFVPTATQ